MKLFKKKKSITLDRGLLAEAISIYSDKINLDKMRCLKDKNIYNDVIKLNEHLTIKVKYIGYKKDVRYIGYYSINFDCFYLRVDTYVDEIHMADYEFELDMRADKELYRRWDCYETKIIHDMPEQFIVLMNEWSKQVVFEFDAKREEKKNERTIKEKQKYNEEECVLSKYR